MPRSLLFVQSNPVPGREREFDDWFLEHHLRDVVQLEGFLAGTLLRKSEFQRNAGGAAHPYRNLAMYELDGPPELGVRALDEASSSGAMALSPLLAAGRLSVVYDRLARIERS